MFSLPTSIKGLVTAKRKQFFLFKKLTIKQMATAATTISSTPAVTPTVRHTTTET